MPRQLLPRAAALSLALASCGEEAPAPAPPPATPATFANVQAVFARACAFSSCHGGTGMRGGLRLGPNDAYSNLVGAPSTQVPRMLRVSPGNPAQSWLVHKLENTMATVQECQGGGVMVCGTSMPERDVMLPAAERDLVRRWIAAGAPR